MAERFSVLTVVNFTSGYEHVTKGARWLHCHGCVPCVALGTILT